MPDAPTPQSLFVAPDSVRLTWLGQTFQPAALVLGSDGSELDAPPEWSSADPSVASVDSEGLITGTGEGTTRIRASVGTLVDSVLVTVSQVPASIDISEDLLSFTALADTLRASAIVTDAGGSTINGELVIWTAADPAVATIDATGLVMAIGPGTTHIEAAAGSASARAEVAVVPEANLIVVEPDSLDFESIGEFQVIVAAALDRNGNPVSESLQWSSGAAGVATVSQDGRVVSLANGSTTIDIRAEAAHASVAVRVRQRPATLTVLPSSRTVSTIGGTADFDAQMSDALGVDIADLEPTWSVSPPGVVTIDSQGRVTSLAEGTATVRAEIEGLSASATVHVAVPPGWEALPDLPQGTWAPAVATDGARIYVFGGEAPGYLNTTQIYDPATRSWSLGAPMPISASWASAAPMVDGIHVVGGVTSSSAAVSSHWIYDPAADIWRAGPDVPTPVAGATAQVVSGRMVVMGGIDGPSHHSANVHIYDLASGSWMAGTPVPGARINWSSAVLGGAIYGAGGGTPGINTGNELLRYVPTSNAWTVLTPLQQPREAHGSGVSGGDFCVFGGRIARSGNFNTPMSSTECYEPSSGQWTFRAPLPLARQALGSVTLGGYMYAVGGQDDVRRGTAHFTRLRF